jgi:hypothetical protein
VDGVAGPSAPPSFSEDDMEEWSLWVLNNGLPGLPVAVGKGQSVPVARLVDNAGAAVLHVQWMWGSNDPDDDYLASEVVCFSQVDGAWRSSGATGGTGWPSAVLGRSNSIGPTEIQRFGVHGEAGRCMATFGITGTAARFIEVETGGRVGPAPLESPVGAWIASWDPSPAATVRVLGDDNTLLHSESYTPWPWSPDVAAATLIATCDGLIAERDRSGSDGKRAANGLDAGG